MGFIETRVLPLRQPKRGWNGRFFHSEHMTFAYYDIEAGAALPAHSHENEEVWHIVQGALNMTLDGRPVRVEAGNAVVIQAGVTHAADADKECRAIVVDYPARHKVAGIEI